MPKIYISPSSQEANLYATGGTEEQYMNQVADILCPELTRHGIEFMRNKIGNDYDDHVKESNAYDPDYHLAIHTNAGGGKGCTSFCFDATDDTRPGTQFATKLYNQIIAISPFPGRGVRSTTMDEVEKVNAPSCLIEIEFHDNPEGADWIKGHIPEIAQALLMGVLEQFGIAYIPPVNYQELYEELWYITEDLKAQNAALKTELDKVNTDLAAANTTIDETRKCIKYLNNI